MITYHDTSSVKLLYKFLILLGHFLPVHQMIVCFGGAQNELGKGFPQMRKLSEAPKNY